LTTFFELNEELSERTVEPCAAPGELLAALRALREPIFVVVTRDGPAALAGGTAALGREPTVNGLPVAAWAPALPPEALGDADFRRAHGVKYAYLTGAMANGIASTELVEAVSRAGMLGFFGSAGLSLESVERAIDRLHGSLGTAPWGSNLIHSPGEPELEARIVDLYLRRGVRLVEASAYMDLTPHVVRYRVAGLREGPEGAVTPRQRIIAKVSRAEVASKFLSPPPERLIAELLAQGKITRQEAALAARIPMADDLTVEADSGGHTDNRPLVALLPALIALRDRLVEEHRYAEWPRVGAAGGISTPASAAAAFAMGAAYVVTGSVNQACVESGSSDAVRAMLAEAESADVAMAPAADMFELGVKVQVLKRGTLFPMRALKLYEVYKSCASLDAIPPAERANLERNFFRAGFEEVWGETKAFFARRDPAQVERAERDPKHKMALVFRSYLGLSSRWANSGEPTRKLDYQVWCGPSMGAFNEWARGSFLEKPEARSVVTVARNILFGAAFTLRVGTLRSQGLRLPREIARASPLEPQLLDELLI